MRKRPKTCLGWAWICSFALLNFVSASDESLASASERLSRQFVLKKGGRLTVENTRGDIHISSWEEDAVELRAETTGNEGDFELVPVEITARNDELNIRSVFPVYAPELKVRVDYRLRVPREVDLKWVKSVNGEVRVSGIRGRAVIEVDNGEISVKDFSGRLKAKTVNGKIEAEIFGVDRSHAVSLENYNGDISLRLPKRIKAHWIVRTLNGDIESDMRFPVQNNFGPQVVDFADGVAEPLIRAYSVNGNIHIARR